MTNPERFDVVVIGTGQGGGPLAGRMAKAGWKTAIIEREHIGGSCINVGCTPTKTMIASARVAYLARRSVDYGVETGTVTVDQAVVRDRKRRIVEQWSSGSLKGLQRWAGSGPEADRLSARMMDAWLAFARTGDPAHGDLPEWPTYDEERRATLVFDREVELRDDPFDEERRAWDGLL